jgi:disulfide bond formation protein DsbB
VTKAGFQAGFCFFVRLFLFLLNFYFLFALTHTVRSRILRALLLLQVFRESIRGMKREVGARSSNAMPTLPPQR